MYETDEVLHDVGYGVLRCSFGKGARAWVGSIFFAEFNLQMQQNSD